MEESEKRRSGRGKQRKKKKRGCTEPALRRHGNLQTDELCAGDTGEPEGDHAGVHDERLGMPLQQLHLAQPPAVTGPVAAQKARRVNRRAVLAEHGLETLHGGQKEVGQVAEKDWRLLQVDKGEHAILDVGQAAG